MSVKLLIKGDGNDPRNPNGMNTYIYQGVIILAYCAKDVPMRYKNNLGIIRHLTHKINPMKPPIKHYSKLYLGFCKQYKRQYDKPREVTIDLPIKIVLPKNFNGVYTHYMEVRNSIWNGMNLNNLLRKVAPINHIGGMYGKFYINKDGKYVLSEYGRRLLKKKKAKLSQ